MATSLNPLQAPSQGPPIGAGMGAGSPPAPLPPPPPKPRTPDPNITRFERPLNSIITQHVFPSIDQEKFQHYLTIRRNDAYYKGQHYLAPTISGGFVDYAPVSGSSALQPISRSSSSPADYTANIYRGDTNKLVAVIGQRAPNVQGAPRVPGNEAQVSRSKLAQQAAFILRSSWRAEDRQPDIVYSLATKGTTLSYTPVVADRDKYGITKIPIFDTVHTPAGPPTFLCEACHAEGEMSEMPAVYSDDRGMCPVCGSEALIAPPMTEPTNIDTGQFEEYVNWAVELHIVAGDRVITPFPIHDIPETPFLVYQYEEDDGKLLQAWPILHDKSQLRATIPTTSDQSGAEARAQLSSPRSLNTLSHTSNRKLLSRIWLRPSMFEYVTNLDERSALKSQYPNGLKITAVDGYVVQLEPERIDDVWAACKPTSAEYLWQGGYMDDMIQCNDIIDDFFALVIETVMRSVPLNIANPKYIDPKVLKLKGRAVAEFIWTKGDSPGKITDGIHTLQMAKVDPLILNLAKEFIDIYRQITGVTAPIFGGGAYATAREAELNRNQALAALSILWNSIRTFWARTYENGVRQLARYATNGKMYFPKAHPDDENEIEIPDLSDVLKGGWILAAEESMPMTPGQIKDYIMSIIELNNPELTDKMGIFHPANLHGIDTALGIPGVRIKDRDTYLALMEIINKLVMSAPTQTPKHDPATGVVIDMEMRPSIEPDTFRFDPTFASQVVREWANSPEGLSTERDNEQGFFHVLLYGKAYSDISAGMDLVGQGAPGEPGAAGAARGSGGNASKEAGGATSAAGSNSLQAAEPPPDAQSEQFAHAA